MNSSQLSEHTTKRSSLKVAADPAPWTVLRLLQWASADFATRGMNNARLEAEVLLAHVLKTNRVGLYLKFESLADEAQRSQFRELVLRRREGVPVGYLVEEREFYSLPFRVNSSVLIPRPETELIVDEVLALSKEWPWSEPRICDVGTGSGAIAITLKKRIPSAQVTGTDRSSEALKVASENASRHQVDIAWVECDLLPTSGFHADVIVANLPYISEADFGALMAEVREHEPRSALVGGPQGTELIYKLVERAPTVLPAGYLILEVGVGQSEGVSAHLEAHGFDVLKVRKDYAGIPRTIVASRRENGS